MRTKQEITTEIWALKALRPFGAFAYRTSHMIHLQIEELQFGFDQAAAEWHEIPGSQQDVIRDASEWKHGRSEQRPSEYWKGLAK